MAAPLRIYGRRSAEHATGQTSRSTGGATAEQTELQSYMDRLVRLIPGEVVGLYLIGIGVIPPPERFATIVWAIICLALVVFVRAYGTSDRANHIPPQWGAVAISTISFLIWIYVMPGPFAIYGIAVPFVGSLAVLVWTFIVPYFYRGDEPAPR